MIALEFPRFLIAGGIAAAANFGSRFVFSIFFSYAFAVFLAYLVVNQAQDCPNKNKPKSQGLDVRSF